MAEPKRGPTRAGGRRWLLREAAAAVLACSASLARAADKPVRIGLSLPLSGVPRRDRALVSYLPPDLGLEYLAAFQAAVDLERHGADIGVLSLDDEFDPAKARANVQTLARQGVIALSGLWTTEHALAALPPVEAAGLPVVGLRSNAPELRGARQPWLFHLRPSLKDELSTMLSTLASAGHRRWAAVHSDDAFGRAALQAMKAQGADLVHVAAVPASTGADALDAAAAQAARAAASAPGVQAVVVLAEGDVLAGAMAELRLRERPFLAPVCGLSNVLCTALATTRQLAYAGFAVASPFDNPQTSRSAVAQRFREAMLARDLDHAVRSFSAFEGFVCGTVLTRAIVGLGPRPTREALAHALRRAVFDLGGLQVAFDDRQVGLRRVSLLYKSSADGLLRA